MISSTFNHFIFSKVLNFFTHSTSTESKDKLVFVFAFHSSESVLKISEVMKSIVTMTGGVSEIVCLYEEESTLKT